MLRRTDVGLRKWMSIFLVSRIGAHWWVWTFDLNAAPKVVTILQEHSVANAARAYAILKDSLSIRHYTMNPSSLLSHVGMMEGRRRIVPYIVENLGNELKVYVTRA